MLSPGATARCSVDVPTARLCARLQLEFAQARKTQGAAEADDRRRADLGPARQRIDIGAQREFRIVEHRRGDLLLRLGQRGGALAHRERADRPRVA